jgi:hypothetical protein
MDPVAWTPFLLPPMGFPLAPGFFCWGGAWEALASTVLQPSAAPPAWEQAPANNILHDTSLVAHRGSRGRRSASPSLASSTFIWADSPSFSGQGGSGNFWDNCPSKSSASSPLSHCSLPHNIAIILQVSPKTGSSTFGYIFLDPHKHHCQEPVTVYFTSAGRDVSALPCPNFDVFLQAHLLCMRNISLVTNLPWYVILLGR